MTLPNIAIVMGLSMGLLYLPMLVAPDTCRTWFKVFPRNKPAAWILTAIALAWGAWLLYATPLGRFDFIKQPRFYFLPPLVYFLIVRFVDDLLAPRALGALLLLIPAPILDAVRWHESLLRLVVVSIAYIMAVKGMLLVLGPYRFRKWNERYITDDRTCRIWGAAGMTIAVATLAIGVVLWGT